MLKYVEADTVEPSLAIVGAEYDPRPTHSIPLSLNEKIFSSPKTI